MYVCCQICYIFGPLPKTKEEYSYILLVVDSFLKWRKAFPLVSINAREVAWKVYDEIICRYHCPRSILTDRSANFVSKLMKALCSIIKSGKINICSKKKQTNWAQLLLSIMLIYIVSPCNRSTGYSQNYVMFG